MSVHYEINSKNISFLTAVFSSIKYCDGQDIWKLSMGLGLPEFLHISVSYQYSAEFLYHFAGEAKTGVQVFYTL